MTNPVAKAAPPAAARLAGLHAYNGQRKQTNRDGLLLAATDLLCERGYASVSVEDITRAAGVSRVTFYRHFPTKAAVAVELFRRASEVSGPRLVEIGARDFTDRATVVAWLTGVFELNREMGGIVRVLSQANAVEAGFSEQVRPYIFDIIAALGKTIPAFALRENLPDDAKQRVRAWLLIYTILDQANHAAKAESVATHPMMIDVLADNFLDFVGDMPAPARDGNGTR